MKQKKSDIAVRLFLVLICSRYKIITMKNHPTSSLLHADFICQTSMYVIKCTVHDLPLLLHTSLAVQYLVNLLDKDVIFNVALVKFFIKMDNIFGNIQVKYICNKKREEIFVYII